MAEHLDLTLFWPMSLCQYTGQDVQLTPTSLYGLSTGDSSRSCDLSLCDRSNKGSYLSGLGFRSSSEAEQRRALS